MNFICFKQSVTVSADIIKIEELPSGKRYSSHFIEKQNVKNPKIIRHNLFKVGDQIMNINFKEGKVLRLIDSNTTLIKYKNGIEKSTVITQLFNKERSYYSVHIGSQFKNKYTTGKVVAVGVNKLIVKNSISGNRCIYYD